MEQVKVGLEVLHHLVHMLLHMVEKEDMDVILVVLVHLIVKNLHIETVEMEVVLSPLEVVKVGVEDMVVMMILVLLVLVIVIV